MNSSYSNLEMAEQTEQYKQNEKQINIDLKKRKMQTTKKWQNIFYIEKISSVHTKTTTTTYNNNKMRILQMPRAK